jgi:hypothetical protein
MNEDYTITERIFHIPVRLFMEELHDTVSKKQDTDLEFYYHPADTGYLSCRAALLLSQSVRKTAYVCFYKG